MFKKTITFDNFNGGKDTETFYFHISRAELIEWETETPGGLQALLQKIVDSNDQGTIFQTFKKIIGMAVGYRDEGKFKKSVAFRDEFLSSEAFSELVFDLLSNEDAASEFMNNVVTGSINVSDAEKANNVFAQPQDDPGKSIPEVQGVTDPAQERERMGYPPIDEQQLKGEPGHPSDVGATSEPQWPNPFVGADATTGSVLDQEKAKVVPTEKKEPRVITQAEAQKMNPEQFRQGLLSGKFVIG